MTVKDILRKKGDTVYFISPEVTVFDALKIMAEKNIGSLLILKDDQLTGIFTERDYARKLILKGKFSKDTMVAEVMLDNPITVALETDIEECMALMTDKFIRHLPVKQKGKPKGIISIGDVVKAIISEQQYIINSLSNYISGSNKS